MAAIDPYSCVPVPIIALSNKKNIGSATGFFHIHDGQPYLVSNWHVFSGRNCYTGQAIDLHARVPDQLRLTMQLKGKIGVWSNHIYVDLHDKDGNPYWKQHRIGQIIDVAILPISISNTIFDVYDIIRPEEDAGMKVQVGTDVFIIGFPLNLQLQGAFPIWKRGSIASEPELNADNLPLFLVDSATREGMSGSPVVARNSGVFHHHDGSIGLGGGTRTVFLGIYSGRYGSSDELSAQLGRVWRRQIIFEVISEGTPGSFELR